MPTPSSKATCSSSAWVLMALLALLAGCIGSRSGGKAAQGRPSMRGIEEYFVSPGVTQYFLLPVSLQGPAGHSATLDFTVRDTVAAVQWMTLRTSLTAPKAYAATDTLLVHDGQGWQSLAGLKVMFTEPNGKAILTRLEAPVPAPLARGVLANSHRGILIGTAGGRHPYQPTSKARKRLAAFASAATPL